MKMIEKDTNEKCFTFVEIMNNEFTNVKIKKEESDDLNSLEEDSLRDVEIKKENIEDEEFLLEVS